MHAAATTRFAVTVLTKLFDNEELQQDDRFLPIRETVTCLARQFNSGLECPQGILLGVLDSLLALIPSFALLIDSLDERCDSPQDRVNDSQLLLRYIQKISLRKGVRVVLFCRPGTFSEDVFGNSCRVCMDEACTRLDIRRFVEQEIERHNHQNPSLVGLRDDIITRISRDCHGMFLWANLMMANLCTAQTANEMSKRLHEFPLALTEIYQQQLNRIHARLGDDQKKRQHQIFLMLAGVHTTLSIHDISDILALDTNTNVTHEGEKLNNPAVAILDLCHPLVTLVRDQVQFVHASAKEFVLQSLLTKEDSDAFLARKCMSKLSQPQYRVWTYPAKLLRQNLLSGLAGTDSPEKAWKESVFYEYACLHWPDHVTALASPSDELLSKVSAFILCNEFVTWSEVLFQLKPNATIGPHIQVRARLMDWHRKLDAQKKSRVPVHDFFVKAHESIFTEFMEKGEDITLIYLPYVRLGQYFNVGGQSAADFQKAYAYKMAVVERYEVVLGRRNPLTLRSKTELLKEFFFQKRFDEAERGLEEVAEIQREVVGDDVLDYFLTRQLLGSAQYSVTKFDPAFNTYTEVAHGFRSLSGQNDMRALVSEMCSGWALERTPSPEEAYRIYDRLLSTWVPLGGADHPFSLMLKTSFGSVCRKLARYRESKVMLLEALTARKALFTIQNQTTVDSVLQLAALLWDSRHGQKVLEYLELIWDSSVLEKDFERRCQAEHMRALVQFEAGSYERPKAVLEQLLYEASGSDRNLHNRELLWIRITLADVLREHGEEDQALMVFSDLVRQRSVAIRLSAPLTDIGYRFPSSLIDEPEPPSQLAIAERALRLVREARAEEAEDLLDQNRLRWRRKQDFWVIQGGPLTDTASLRESGLLEYQLLDRPVDVGNETALLHSADDQYPLGELGRPHNVATCLAKNDQITLVHR